MKFHTADLWTRHPLGEIWGEVIGNRLSARWACNPRRRSSGGSRRASTLLAFRFSPSGVTVAAETWERFLDPAKSQAYHRQWR